LVVDLDPRLEELLDDSTVALVPHCIQGSVTSFASGIDIGPVLEQIAK
jgi:hypothetical protein